MAEQVVSDVVINYKSVGLDKVGSEIKQVSTSLDGLVVASTSAEKATASLENRFKGLERSFGTTEGQAAKFAKVQADVNKAVGQNPALMERGNQVLAQAAERYGMVATATGKAADSTKLAGYEVINLGRQLQDVAVSLQGGQGLGTVLAQQGSQIFDVFSTSKATFAGVKEQLLGIVTPARLAMGGMVALGGAAVVAAVQWANAQKEIETALIGIGRRTGTTAADINAFAVANASATGLSVSEARNVAIEFTKTGEIAVGQLKGLGEAVYGFSILTGKTAAEAAKDLGKALGGDLVAGAKALDQVYGSLDGRTLQLIATLQATGDKQRAQQIIVTALAEQNKKAEDSVDGLTQAYNFLANAASKAMAVVGKGLTHPALGNLPNYNAAPSDLQQQSAANQGQMAKETQSGDAAVRALLPQIDAYEKLLRLQEDLNRARASSGAQGLGGFNEAAATAAENVAKATKEALETSIQYNQRVKEIADSYQGLSTSAAQAAQAAQNMLPVMQAIGGAAQMAAQFSADIATELDRGKSAADALSESADKLIARQAQAVSSATQTTQEMERQNELAKTKTLSEEKDVAVKQAYLKVLQEIGDTEEGQEAARARARAVAESYQHKIDISQTGATTQAEKDAAIEKQELQRKRAAIEESDRAADALHQHFVGVAAAAAQAADESQRINTALQEAERAAILIQGALGGVVAGDKFTPSNLNKWGDLSGMGSSMNMYSFGGGEVYAVQPGSSNEAVALAYAADPTYGVSPGNQPLQNAVSDLTDSTDALKSSTDDLNRTNQELLSPYYTQDPRTSNIGFRSQGMASGGYVDVPGAPSANDNMIAQIPVAGGERIYVDPMHSKRGGSGGSVININVPIMINGNANRDEIGRTVYQSMQIASRSIAAASR